VTLGPRRPFVEAESGERAPVRGRMGQCVYGSFSHSANGQAIRSRVALGSLLWRRSSVRSAC